jgi:hypothetical protein
VTDPRTRPDGDSGRRLRAERLAARALVANYIHELSERHGAAEQPGGAAGDELASQDAPTEK